MKRLKRKGEKMLRKRSKIWLLSVMAITGTLLVSMLFTAGCGTNTAETAAETTMAEETTAAATTAAQTSAAEETEAAMQFEGKTLIISGSTTLLEVSQAWADAFMAKYGGEITVNGGGSGVGIADMINGTNDLGNSSRKIKDEEAEEAKNAGADVREFMVLYDGIAVIVSKNIEITELTINQLSDIFTGKITNWKEVGGPDANIVAAGRDSASGTGEYFLERVVQLNKTLKDNDYGDMILRLQSNADVANQVSGNDNCSGYIGLGYLAGVSGKANTVAVIAEDGTEAIMPTVDTVKDKSYPIARDLFVYADGNKYSDIAAAFVDFMLSDEGQAIGEDSGFVSIK
jgi:phosphate transport system substrate-binding protein